MFKNLVPRPRKHIASLLQLNYIYKKFCCLFSEPNGIYKYCGRYLESVHIITTNHYSVKIIQAHKRIRIYNRNSLTRVSSGVKTRRLVTAVLFLTALNQETQSLSDTRFHITYWTPESESTDRLFLSEDV
jgi:hypothetical protein